MVRHILRSGTELFDITGHEVETENAVYNLIAQINGGKHGPKEKEQNFNRDYKGRGGSDGAICLLR